MFHYMRLLIYSIRKITFGSENVGENWYSIIYFFCDERMIVDFYFV